MNSFRNVDRSLRDQTRLFLRKHVSHRVISPTVRASYIVVENAL